MRFSTASLALLLTLGMFCGSPAYATSSVVSPAPVRLFTVFHEVTDTASATTALHMLAARAASGLTHPSDAITRAEALHAAVLAAGITLVPVDAPCYPDVNIRTWYASTVCAGKNLNLIPDTGDGFFHPSRLLTAAEALHLVATMDTRTSDTSSHPQTTIPLQPVSPASLTPTPPALSDSDSAAVDQVLTSTNAERAKAHVDPLTRNAKLDSSAQTYATELATTGVFSHTGQESSTPKSRVNAAGYRSTCIGENLAFGQGTAAYVMDAWMASAGHRENIVAPDYHDIGIGLAWSATGVPYWVQDFGCGAE